MRFTFLSLLVLAPLSLTAPTSSSSLAVREPVPVPAAAPISTDLLPRQAGQSDINAIVDSFRDFIKETLSQFGLSSPPKTKRQAGAAGGAGQGFDLTATLDKLGEFLKTLFDNIDFNTLQEVQKRQEVNTDAIIDALKEFIKEALSSLGGAFSAEEGKVKRQAQTGTITGLDFAGTIDKLAEFLKTLFNNIDFNKLQKRQEVNTDAIVDALKEFVKEAPPALGGALGGAEKVKRQAQTGGLDLTGTIDKLAEFLKQLLGNIDF